MFELFERVRDWWQARHTQQVTPEMARERVKRGASYLDEVDPNWYQRVNSETLELGDGQHCILGQLHGEFQLGLGRSQLITMSSAPRASLSPVSYGFKCVEGVPEPWQARDYELLNEAWREAVQTRQRNDAASDSVEASTTGDSLPTDAVEFTSSPSPGE